MSSQPPPQSNSDSQTLIANPWHTLFAVIAVALYAYRAIGNAAQARAILLPNRPHLYFRTILTELVFLAIVAFGVRLHGTSLQSIFGQRWRSAGQMFLDLGIGISLLFVSNILVAVVTVIEHDRSTIETIQFLLPQTPLEFFLWVLLSIVAGICEEAIYRGYFQRQFAALAHSVPAGILLSAAAFGAVHAYQGWRRALAIAIMAALFGLVAQWRKTVRPGMIAHALQDSLAPLLVKLIRH